MKNASIALLLILAGCRGYGQTAPLTLDECLSRARENYPLIRQHELISRTKEYSVANAGKGWLPQLSFSGQASYQSETIAFPFKIPGVTLPVYSKDQYRVQAEVDQTLYDGGAIRYQREQRNAEAHIQEQELEVNLYALKDRIDQLFFGILLIDGQLTLNDLQRTDLQNGMEQMQAALKNGTAFRSSLDELKAEVLNSDQARTELLAARKSYGQMLSLFINEPVDESRMLVTPPGVSVSAEIKRPELVLFDYRRAVFSIQEKQLRLNYLPKVGAYVQGAYGRPTLNFISNDFGFWAIGGVRFSWALTGLYSHKNDKRLLELDRRNLDLQKETFLFNTRLTLIQQNEEAVKYQALLNQDQEIVDLRASVKSAALAQLRNGVITSHDYITRVNAESLARQSLILHKIQLLQAEYNSLTTSGQ
ncbi:MAG: TolC family protein [Bacteroidota bacterium]|nr:TolC family protein [Bacteroidota bacterium]MDP4244242.1 TolC family protein [Bacteroidota bacterium]MDP4255977.1 TolC family protein [Bacteroidota bacterium]MDP4257011.1 TolC family protein [Bacteroidota bacterium]